MGCHPLEHALVPWGEAKPEMAVFSLLGKGVVCAFNKKEGAEGTGGGDSLYIKFLELYHGTREPYTQPQENQGCELSGKMMFI